MEESKNLEQNLDKSNEKLHISDVSDSDLINQIKKCKDEVIEDMEIAGYPMESPLIDSLVDLIKLIERL
jgi:hypothetical protein